ncbi:hypothetical protein BASA81_010152 [Batrachochytrium salamandrivorans]|nr:hypothetical protein BASA81_010152 [Batrachochytrium salamandrivorans]
MSCFQRWRNSALRRFDSFKPLLFHLLLWGGLVASFSALSVALQSSPCWDSQGEYSLLQQNSPAVPFPLKHAHSHNDYAQSMPLTAALLAGFCSIEADVFMKNSRLFVGHQFITPTDHTLSLLESYLLPLMARSSANGNGPIYPQATKLQTCLQITLLVDIKSSNAMDTYKQLEGDLERLNQNFTYFETFGGGTASALPAPVSVVVTGLKPQHVEEIVRWVALRNGTRRTSLDLSYESQAPQELALSRWISHRWNFGRSSGDHEYIQQRVQFARENNLQLRFWNTPEDPALWQALLDLGVDLINTDRIFTLRSFLAG